MSGIPSTSNGSSAPPTPPEVPEKKPFPRLASFKLPRDLTLGAGTAGTAKINKKVFTPNLNVVRNKNKTDRAVPNLRENNKKDNEKNRRDKQNNKKQNGPTVLKSSGVFSEGLGTSERITTRSSYSRDSDSAPTALTRPVLRMKDTRKIDKELEEQKLKKALGESQLNASDDEEAASPAALHEAPLRLPISAGGTLYSAKKDIKKSATNLHEVVVKKEPDDGAGIEDGVEKKYVPEVAASAFDSTDIVGLLNSDKPRIMFLQLPDNLPGRGVEDETPQNKNKPAHSAEDETKEPDNKCKLQDLEEGKIGKIQIHKSGKIKLLIGDTAFDLTIGTLPCFREDVVSVAVDPDTKTATMINLGGIDKKLNIIPDWEALFSNAVV